MVRTCLKISAITALLLSANVVGMEEPNAAVNEEAKKCPRTPSLPVAELPAEILSNPAGRGAGCFCIALGRRDGTRTSCIWSSSERDLLIKNP